MKTNITRMGAVLLAIGICICSTHVFAQSTTTVTTTKGAFTEYVPGSETMVLRTESGSAPLRYTVTKQTTIVDESCAPVPIERISPGTSLSIEYTGSGDHFVASRVVVQRPAAAAVTEQETSTTTRELTHDEKHALKEAREHQKKEAKKAIEKQKDALDKEKDKLDDDDKD